MSALEQPEQAESLTARTITFSRVVDLSHPIDQNIPRWPGDPPVEFQTVARLDRDGYFLRRFSMGEHSGTHINSPASFHPGGADLSDLPAHQLVVPAAVIDVREQTAGNRDYVLTLEDLLAWERGNGMIPPGHLVLLYTGWQEQWRRAAAFLGQDAAGTLHFPGFGVAAVRFLLEERGIAGIGIDTHGVDPGADDTFAVNRLVLASPRLVLENLTNLDQLPPLGATLVIGILRLKGGSGSPVSVLALVP
jgi:kynurenine formamidase